MNVISRSTLALAVAIAGLACAGPIFGQPGSQDEVRSSAFITSYARIRFFEEDYSYTAYQRGIVVRHTPSGRTETVAVRGADFPIKAGFAKALAKDALLASRLGRSLSPVVPIFDGKVQAQVFVGGAMLYESRSNNNWWNWHTRRQVGPGHDTIVLPKEPGAWVITLDYRGGLTLPRKNQDPYLLIRNDGRVTVNDPFGLKPRLETRIPMAEVRELMHFALVKNDFFSLNGADIDKAVRQEVQRKKAPQVMDMHKTVVRIRTHHQTHEVTSYAVDFYAERLPNIAALQKLHRIETRLNRLMDQLRGE